MVDVSKQTIPLDPKTHGKMKVLNPQYMGVINPKNEGTVSSRGTLSVWDKEPKVFTGIIHVRNSTSSPHHTEDGLPGRPLRTGLFPL